MAFCNTCGNRIDNTDDYCPFCGTAVDVIKPEDEKAGCGWICLSFFFPFIGFILWLAWKNHQPTKASTVCTTAWIGISMTLFFNLVAFILGAV